MAEHVRENGYQWCDTDVYIVVDKFCGPEYVAGEGYYMPLDKALTYAKERQGWESRTIVVKANCIAGFKLKISAWDRQEQE